MTFITAARKHIDIDKYAPIRRGVSLIEMLVVFAIVSMLVAILLPSLHGARNQARRVQCMANLRTLMGGWHAYLHDSDGRFLRAQNAHINYGGIQGLGSTQYGHPSEPGSQIHKPLNAYIGLPTIANDPYTSFLCPADKGGRTVRPMHYNYYGTSYVTNEFLVGNVQLEQSTAGDTCRHSPYYLMYKVNAKLRKLRLTQVAHPGRVVMMGDFGWVNSVLPGANLARADWHGQACSHSLAFLDGHVEFMRLDKGMLAGRHYQMVPFEPELSTTRECQQAESCD